MTKMELRPHVKTGWVVRRMQRYNVDTKKTVWTVAIAWKHTRHDEEEVDVSEAVFEQAWAGREVRSTELIEFCKLTLD